MKQHLRLLGLACCLLILALAFPCSAGSSPAWPDKAQTALKQMVDDVLVIIRDPDLSKAPKTQEQALYDKAFQIFDFDTFSMLALGPKYRKFSQKQREDFILYFSRLISQTYFPKLSGKDVHNLSIAYVKNDPLEPRRGIYRTDILTELNQKELQVPIVYRMIQKEGSADWRVYDIKIEGVSMAANYREQYRQQINSTPDEIIAELKQKVSP